MALKRDVVRERLLDLVEELPIGAALPGERTLAPRLEVSRMTLRSAIDELVRRGLLVRRQGSGTVVASHRTTAVPPLRMVSFTQDMRSRGLDPSSRTLSLETAPAGPRVGRRLAVPPETLVHTALRLRLADGTAMALETLHVPASLVPGLDAVALEQTGLYGLLAAAGVAPTGGTQSVEPTVLEAEEARLLDVPLHSPAFLFERSAHDARGRTVEFVRSLFRGDRYALVAELVLPDPAPVPSPRTAAAPARVERHAR
ncbi:MAG: GntR family transcriptional regulator [Blastococcus sp.]|jgi:GntR family transcriptional regulator|nr:GntR family transcriptional regulator [Blastococcus sp.]